MNALAKIETSALSTMTEAELCRVLQTSLYPGANLESIKMVLGYCKASGLDPMQKPVHIVPMWDSKAKQMRDVIMPGVNLYRTQAARSGECAGVTEPEFGPDTTRTLGGQEITFPLWCRATVKRRLPSGDIVEFTAREFWTENYAVKGGQEKSVAPNAMWTKRPYGQIAKCAEAQALRKAFPEIASAVTAEEMEGKPMQHDDVPPAVFDYIDPAPILAGVAELQTDEEAAVYWKDNSAKLAKQRSDYATLKQAIIDKRLSLKKQQAAIDNLLSKEAEPAAIDAPEITFDLVAQRMNDSKDLDDLNAAFDLANAITEPKQRAVLDAKYVALKAVLEADWP